MGIVTIWSALSAQLFFEAFGIKARVERVVVLAVELVGQQPQIFAEALIMHDLSRSEESDWIDHVGIVAEAQDVVICRARLLFCREILVKIRDGIALARDRRRIERNACRRRGIDARGMIDKVGVKALLFDLVLAEIARQLIDDRADHFEVVEFFRAP